jgi:hypothetical protein
MCLYTNPYTYIYTDMTHDNIIYIHIYKYIITSAMWSSTLNHITYIHKSIDMLIYIHIYTYIHLYIYIHTYPYAHTHLYTHIYIYINIIKK